MMVATCVRKNFKWIIQLKHSFVKVNTIFRVVELRKNERKNRRKEKVKESST